jgi:hypothetical protein
MRTFTSANEIVTAVGEELGTSEWVTVTQEQVNTFADAAGDHQWIHVDAERAERESPFGGPIAPRIPELVVAAEVGLADLHRRGRQDGHQLRVEQGTVPGPSSGGRQAKTALDLAGRRAVAGRNGADDCQSGSRNRRTPETGGCCRNHQPGRVLSVWSFPTPEMPRRVNDPRGRRPPIRFGYCLSAEDPNGDRDTPH